MKFIDKLRSLKKKVDSSLVSGHIDPIVEPTQTYSMPIPGSRKIRECNHCHKPILPEDKYSKQVGDYYHRKCWRELVKMV